MQDPNMSLDSLLQSRPVDDEGHSQYYLPQAGLLLGIPFALSSDNRRKNYTGNPFQFLKRS